MKDNYYRHINDVPYKMHCFIEMQFVAYFYTVVPYCNMPASVHACHIVLNFSNLIHLNLEA